MGFFGIIALILAVIATAFFIPVMGTYLATGLVPDFPTPIVCGFTMLSAIQSLFVGVTLETMAQKNRQDFEMQLQRVTAEKKRLCGEKMTQTDHHCFRIRMPCILPFFEYFIEITGVIHAAEPRDFLNRGIAVAQKLFGMGDFFAST